MRLSISLGYIVSEANHRLAALSVLLTLFQSVNDLSQTGQKKTPAGPQDPRSSFLFPKASAKVRPFSLTGKFWKDFFDEKPKIAPFGKKNGKIGKKTHLIILLGKTHSRRSATLRTHWRYPLIISNRSFVSASCPNLRHCSGEGSPSQRRTFADSTTSPRATGGSK